MKAFIASLFGLMMALMFIAACLGCLVTLGIFAKSAVEMIAGGLQ